MKKILLPTDFSENSWNALQYAARLFKDTACEFLLLNTYHPAPADINTVSIDYSDADARLADVELERIMNRFASLVHHPKSTIIKKGIYGELSHNIDELCKKIEFSYIVMGTKGAGGMKEVLIGSNTVQIMKTVKAPLICVPENARFSSPFNIVFASDFEEIENERDLMPLKEMTRISNLPLNILIVRNKITIPSSIKDAREELELAHFLGDIDHHIIIKDNENVSKEIIDFANLKKAGLVVMLKRKHDFWEKLFNQSITKKVAFHTNIPLLIMHESADK